MPSPLAPLIQPQPFGSQTTFDQNPDFAVRDNNSRVPQKKPTKILEKTDNSIVEYKNNNARRASTDEFTEKGMISSNKKLFIENLAKDDLSKNLNSNNLPDRTRSIILEDENGKTFSQCINMGMPLSDFFHKGNEKISIENLQLLIDHKARKHNINFLPINGGECFAKKFRQECAQKPSDHFDNQHEVSLFMEYDTEHEITSRLIYRLEYLPDLYNYLYFQLCSNCINKNNSRDLLVIEQLLNKLEDLFSSDQFDLVGALMRKDHAGITNKEQAFASLGNKFPHLGKILNEYIKTTRHRFGEFAREILSANTGLGPKKHAELIKNEMERCKNKNQFFAYIVPIHEVPISSAKGHSHVEAVIITKDKILNLIPSFSFSSRAKIFSFFLPEQVYYSGINRFVIASSILKPLILPQASEFECTSLSLAYTKEYLKNNAEQLNKFTLLVSGENASDNFLLPSPQVLRYSQSGLYNKILYAMVKSDAPAEIVQHEEGEEYTVTTLIGMINEKNMAAQSVNGATFSKKTLDEFRKNWIDTYKKYNKIREEMNFESKNVTLSYRHQKNLELLKDISLHTIRL